MGARKCPHIQNIASVEVVRPSCAFIETRMQTCSSRIRSSLNKLKSQILNQSKGRIYSFQKHTPISLRTKRSHSSTGRPSYGTTPPLTRIPTTYSLRPRTTRPPQSETDLTSLVDQANFNNPTPETITAITAHLSDTIPLSAFDQKTTLRNMPSPKARVARPTNRSALHEPADHRDLDVGFVRVFQSVCASRTVSAKLGSGVPYARLGFDWQLIT